MNKSEILYVLRLIESNFDDSYYRVVSLIASIEESLQKPTAKKFEFPDFNDGSPLSKSMFGEPTEEFK